MLLILVVANLSASAAHFAHNAVFFEAYPEPSWIPGAWFIVVVWCVVAPFLALGYYWDRRGQPKRAAAAFFVYCASGLLVFGHYLYGPPRELSLLANALIFLEGVAALVLLGHVLTRHQNREQHARS